MAIQSGLLRYARNDDLMALPRESNDVTSRRMEMTQHSPAVRRWIFFCMVLVVLMVAIGGFTRLTESGLSIVEWKLVSGMLPPLSDAAWEKEFAAYQTSPQFEQVNKNFTVSDFKQIFWLEYLHRLLGRIIGLAVILPFFYFLARRKLSRPMVKRGVLLSVLVASQGAVGWIMVASGLVDAPRVAPIKLALHLSLAFVFFFALIWTYWQLKGYPRYKSNMAFHARLLLLLVFIQIIFGALVAGLDAGLTYNTYPWMDGQFIPDNLRPLTPWWKNHLESVLTVQFQHRMAALVVVIAALAFVKAAWGKSTPAEQRWLKWLLWAVFLQFLLGVATLLTVVEMHLAVAHQLGALVLASITLRLCYQHSRP